MSSFEDYTAFIGLGEYQRMEGKFLYGKRKD